MLGTGCGIAYLEDVIVFDSDPSTYVKTIRALFERLRKHNLKLSPSKARLGATDADFLSHSISPAGVRPNAEKLSALTLMPMPRDLKQLRSLLGGLSYYRKFLPDMSKRIRPTTALLEKGVNCLFTPSMKVYYTIDLMLLLLDLRYSPLAAHDPSLQHTVSCLRLPYRFSSNKR